MGRKKIGIRQLKNEASRIVKEVRESEAEYVVTRRGEPVAVIRPIKEADVESDVDVERAAYAQSVMRMLRQTAKELGELSSGESAASVVSRQRR